MQNNFEKPDFTNNFTDKYSIMSDLKDKNQLNIELSEEIADGIYSNLAIITHSSAEFVIDFIRVMPGVPITFPNLRIHTEI